MPVIDKEDVIKLVRKELDRQMSGVCQQLGVDEEMPEDDSEEEPEDDEDDGEESKSQKPTQLDVTKVSPGLRVVHVDSGLEYPIVGLTKDRKTVRLRSSDNYIFDVPSDEFERDYELD